MGSIDNLSELNYIFKGTKLSLDNAKAGLKTFFTKANNKVDIFEAMKPELKERLKIFPQLARASSSCPQTKARKSR